MPEIVTEEVTEENALEESPQEESTQPIDENIVEDWNPEKVLEKVRKQNAELKKLRDRAKAAEAAAEEASARTADSEALTQTNSQLSQDNELLTAQLLKYEVAFELGLPKQLVSRLSGATKEEMLEDAEALLEMFQTKAPPTDRPTLRGGSTPYDSGKRTTADLFAEAMKEIVN